MADKTLNQVVQQTRAKIAKRNDAALAALADIYRGSYKRLDTLIKALVDEIGAKEPTLGQLARMQRYQELQAQMKAQLDDLTGVVKTQAQTGVIQGTEAGQADALALLKAASPQLTREYNRLNTEAIEVITGMVDPGSPLYERISQLSPNTLAKVLADLSEGVALGFGPAKLAGVIRDAYGQGLTDALRMVRTAQIYAYRSASRGIYLANQDVVQRWVWYANLDSRVCASCVVMHGRVQQLSWYLNDHYNGRCTMVPMTSAEANPVEESGINWLSRQPDAVQREIMGPLYWKAWKDGAISLGQLSTEQPAIVYGRMRGVPPLKSLVSEDYYKSLRSGAAPTGGGKPPAPAAKKDEPAPKAKPEEARKPLPKAFNLKNEEYFGPMPDEIKTHDDLERFCKEYLGLKEVDFSLFRHANQSQEAVYREIADTLYKMSKVFPEPFSWLEKIGTPTSAYEKEYEKNNPDSNAWANGHNRSITFSTSFATDLAAADGMKAWGAYTGWYPVNVKTWTSTLIHEFGHFVDYSMNIYKVYLIPGSDSARSRMAEVLIKFQENYWPAANRAGVAPSQYGKSKKSEFFAESFAEAMTEYLGGRNAGSRAGKALREVFDLIMEAREYPLVYTNMAPKDEAQTQAFQTLARLQLDDFYMNGINTKK